MAIRAADFVRGMRPRHPVADAFVASVAAQASAVGINRGTFSKGYDFGNITSTVHVQAACSVTLFTLHALLRMKRMAKILGYVLVAGGTNLGPDWFRARNLYELGKRRDCIFGFFGRVGG
jgi:hypothetical protein